MTLADVCEPLFQYVCLLNRSARKGGTHAMAAVRQDIEGLLADMRKQASADGKLHEQYERIEPVLLFFVDGTIKQSNLSFAGQWQDLALARGEAGGDERFFDLLDETLADPHPAAAERLQVFYTCLGLGFTGWFQGQPDFLRRKMSEVSGRIRSFSESDQTSRIVPEAYEHVNTSNLVEPPGSSLLGIGIVLLGLLVVVFVANLYLYRTSSSNLTSGVDRIVDSNTVADRKEP